MRHGFILAIEICQVMLLCASWHFSYRKVVHLCITKYCCLLVTKKCFAHQYKDSSSDCTIPGYPNEIVSSTCTRETMCLQAAGTQTEDPPPAIPAAVGNEVEQLGGARLWALTMKCAGNEVYSPSSIFRRKSNFHLSVQVLTYAVWALLVSWWSEKDISIVQSALSTEPQRSGKTQLHLLACSFQPCAQPFCSSGGHDWGCSPSLSASIPCRLPIILKLSTGSLCLRAVPTFGDDSGASPCQVRIVQVMVHLDPAPPAGLFWPSHFTF